MRTPASQATEVVRRVVRRLVPKVVSRWTSLRTTRRTRRRMTFDLGSSWFRREELATLPPADEGEIAGEAAPDPSLPTTGWRGRRQPPNLVKMAGGGVVSWEGTGRTSEIGKRTRESGRGKGEEESEGKRERKAGEEGGRGRGRGKRETKAGDESGEGKREKGGGRVKRWVQLRDR